MSEFQQAAEKAKNLGRQLKAVIEVGEFLESIASAEQAKVEADAAATKAYEARDRAIADYEVEYKKLEEAVRNKVEAEKLARQVSRDTDAKRQQIIQNAKTEAEQIVAKAKADAAKRVSDAEAIARERREEAAEATRVRDGERAELKRVQDEIAALKQRLGVS